MRTLLRLLLVLTIAGLAAAVLVDPIGYDPRPWLEDVGRGARSAFGSLRLTPPGT